MPRIRSIKPEYWQDTRLSRMGILDRLVFLCLLSMADDEGRLEGDAEAVQRFGFPREDPGEIWKALDRLGASGRIRIYQHDGNPYLLVVNFKKHQRPSHPSPSKLPPSPEDSGGLQKTREASGNGCREWELEGGGEMERGGSGGGGRAAPHPPDNVHPKPPNTPQNRLLVRFQEIHLLKRKQPYGLTAYRRDAALMAKCIAEFGEEETEARIRRFFDRAGDKFLEKAGFTVPIFVSQINSLGKSPEARGYPINRVI